MQIRTVRCLAATLLAGTVCRPSGANAQTTPVRVAYVAAAGCPPGPDFAAAVAVRGRNVLAVDDDSPSVIRVAIAAEPNRGYRGTLRMGSSDEGAREVHGATCRDVVDALALVAVSSLGPAEALPASPTTSERAMAPPAPQPTPAEAPIAPRVANLPDRRPEDRTRAAPLEPLLVPAGTLTFDSTNSFGVFGGVMTGLIPKVVVPRIDFIEAARTNLVTSPDGHTYRVWPTVRLHGSLFPSLKYHSAYGMTNASGGLALGADVCGAVYYDRNGLQVLVCPEFMVGYTAVTTTTPPGVRVDNGLEGFGTVGLGLDLTYDVGRHFQVGLKTGGAVLLGGLKAEASDGATLMQSSKWSLHGMLGAGGHF